MSCLANLFHWNHSSRLDVSHLLVDVTAEADVAHNQVVFQMIEYDRWRAVQRVGVAAQITVGQFLLHAPGHFVIETEIAVGERDVAILAIPGLFL